MNFMGVALEQGKLKPLIFPNVSHGLDRSFIVIRQVREGTYIDDRLQQLC